MYLEGQLRIAQLILCITSYLLIDKEWIEDTIGAVTAQGMDRADQ